MIDLKAPPFRLDNEGIEWLNRTLAGMDVDARIGQLFCLLAFSTEEAEARKTIELVRPGGILFRPSPGAALQKITGYLQTISDVPMLVAANLERGGNGIATDGTYFASPMQIAATDNEEQAYLLGVICGREGRAVGCNWTFSPNVDLDLNFHNPITNTRTFGSDPERVLRMARAYMRGVHEHGMATCLKHWPGDGVDERDQHLAVTVNSLTCETWDSSYGKVYRALIEAGAPAVMSGHIQMPAHSRRLAPGICDEDIMPASLAPELLLTLLRRELGFNGLIITDATAMAGFTMLMPRSKAVPYSIAAGNDMFLFTLNLHEDLEFMRQGVKDGILSLERLDEAVTRILALKAWLKLHRRKQVGESAPVASALDVLHCAEHRAWTHECADKAVTLVKDKENLLPLTTEKHRRILLFVLGDEGGYLGDNSLPGHQTFQRLLEAEGFQVEKFDYAKDMGERWAMIFQPVDAFKKRYDLVLYYASLQTASNQTVVRINWAQPLGFDSPRLLSDIPTTFVSVESPYHLLDVPRVKTFINGYSGTSEVIEAIVRKLLGKSPFKGINPVDPFCGLWDAKL
jgi:beta-N-acetylhexosaminidase